MKAWGSRPGSLEHSLLTDPERARPHFQEARQRAERLGVFLHLPSLDGTTDECRQPFEHLFVRHDGTVRGCCSGLFEPADYGLSAGRIETPPEELWRAPILEQFRAASRAGRDSDLPQTCQTCAFRLPQLGAHDRRLSVLTPSPGARRAG